jgi:hypothetical protein
MIVRAVPTYTTMLWWPRAKYRTSRAKFSELQRLACLGLTGAMRTAPTGVNEILLGLPAHVKREAEAQAGIYRLNCNKQ